MKRRPDINEFMTIKYMDLFYNCCLNWFTTILFLICIGFFSFFIGGCATSKKGSVGAAENAGTHDEHTLPEKYMSEGISYYKNGGFESAIADWLKAAQLFEEEERFQKQAEALILISQGYQAIGHYEDALKNLEKSLQIAHISDEINLIASILSIKGNTYLALGDTQKAHRYLTEALGLSREMKNAELEATILNNFGNLLSYQGSYDEANRAYGESNKIASKIGNQELATAALINAALSSFNNKEYEKSDLLLKKAQDQIIIMPPSHDKCYGLINIGLTYYDLSSHLKKSKNRLLTDAYGILYEAASTSKEIGDLHSLSYALGYIGTFYENLGQYEASLAHTRQAVFAAQQTNSPESLYLWQWQTGRLLKAQNQLDEAIDAYRNAVDTIESTRREVTVVYGRQHTSFRRSAGPLYFEFVDLLLQRAAMTDVREQYEPYLFEARSMVEMVKIVELRDYFRDDCVDKAQARVTRLDEVSKTAVVVYPILLPDRIELLVSLPGGLKRYSIPVKARLVEAEIRQFRKRLEMPFSGQYQSHAKKLYDWIVRPLEEDLNPLSIDTLVFVPDGPLRTIPMAALHDGKQFLIEKYALAVTPGLDLSDPRPIETKQPKVLLAGLSESSQGFPPLQFIPEELKAIQHIYGGKVLLNEDFLLSNLEQSLEKESFNIVHIATHAKFESDVHKTFLLTFDDKLTLDRLDQCVGFFRFRDEPLELLTLSACETAAGDDRAALGLAGVAVKAGARSALATLWSINDQAAAMLVSEFYRQLSEPAVSRAVALQRAQLKLLKDVRCEHPSYWSPFLLINNWL